MLFFLKKTNELKKKPTGVGVRATEVGTNYIIGMGGGEWFLFS